VWLVLVAMVVLLALAAPAGGQDVVGGAIYVAVLAVMALPGKVGAVVVALVALASEMVPRVVDGWSADNFFAFQVIVASFAAWGITQVIARNADLLQAREEIARLAVADERARMSRDLHDILGHSLTVITVKAELAGRLAEVEGAPQARAEIGDVERLAREALADVRATVGGMRGVTLAGELAGARTALEAAGIDAHLPSSVDDVPVAWRELFAWTVREGVTNVVRHSRAEQCVVRLSPRAVEVRDDGCGPACSDLHVEDPGAAGIARQHGTDGHGLAGLRERAGQLGARMSVGSGAGADGSPGFVLRVEVPA
jgi:two-component system sensor histidine kinase DesK